MTEHVITIIDYPEHRPGLTYYRVQCSCGWHPMGAARIRQIAQDAGAAHVKLALL